MTEDDTFRMLSRHPLDSVRNRLQDKINEMEDMEEVEAFLNPLGWTADELMIEMKLEKSPNYE